MAETQNPVLIRYNRPNIWRCRDVRLIPGINEVEGRHWKAVEGHPLLQDRIKAGDINVVKGPEAIPEATAENEKAGAEEGNESSPTSLSNYTVAECRDLVAETYDPELLKKWLSGENRKTVVTVIQEQIKKIEVLKKEDLGS